MLNLWLADRSRYEEGTAHCERSRFLGYHAGAHGYGFVRKSGSLPLLTGTAVAEVQEKIHQWIVDYQKLPSEEGIQHWILSAQQAYQLTVAERGLQHTIDADQLQHTTQEQCTLLASIVWLWADVGLPRLLEEWEILEVEEEGLSVFGCTCGLGDRLGTAEQHDARECQGFAYMTRGDLVCRHRVQRDRYSYHEFKCPGETNVNTDAAWGYRVQLISGVWGAEDRLGHPIDEVYLHQHVKGKRQAEWDAEEKKPVGPKFQDSPLVYAWYRPANPPLQPEDWADSYNYVDAEGKNRKLGKTYSRRGVWLMPYESALSAEHYWGRWMDSGLHASKYRVLGPFYRKTARLDQFERQLVGEERRWQAICWELAESGHVWGEPEYTALLDKLVPQTRGQACHSYYGEPCAMLHLCDQLDGWQDPLGTGKYLMRRPHHAPELAQAIERGLIPAEMAAEEGVE